MARILIADDDLITRMELSEMLDAAGHDLVGRRKPDNKPYKWHGLFIPTSL